MLLALESGSDLWIIDSSASFYATLRKDLFMNYMPSKFGKVYLGDYDTCDIIGKGNVRLVQHNEIVLILKGIRYVPRLVRKLIYVG